MKHLKVLRKQASRGILRKRCSENHPCRSVISRKLLQLYWFQTSAWAFLKNTSGRLPLVLCSHVHLNISNEVDVFVWKLKNLEDNVNLCIRLKLQFIEEQLQLAIMKNYNHEYKRSSIFRRFIIHLCFIGKCIIQYK